MRVRAALLVCIIAPAAAHAQTGQWQLGATPTFSSGKYGTDTRTEIVYTPVVARRMFADGDLTLVVPHLCITGNSTVAVLNGSPVRTERVESSRGTTTPAMRDRAARSAATVTETGARDEATRSCGLGDLVVRGRYYLLNERGWMPTIAVRGHLKAPTADAERGLGTGKPDEGFGVEVSRMVGGTFAVLADGGYTVIGKPRDTRFRNAWWYDVGVAQDLARGAVNVSVFFEEYGSVDPAFENARDVLLTLGIKGTAGWRVQVAGELGLSNGAPDHGFTIGASRRF